MNQNKVSILLDAVENARGKVASVTKELEQLNAVNQKAALISQKVSGALAANRVQQEAVKQTLEKQAAAQAKMNLILGKVSPVLREKFQREEESRRSSLASAAAATTAAKAQSQAAAATAAGGQAASRAKRDFEGFNTVLQRNRSALLAIQVAAAAATAAFVGFLTKAVKSGLNFNSTVEDAQLGIAALLRTFEPDKFDSFDQAFQAAGAAIDKLKGQALKSPATLRQLIEAFQATAGAALGAGIEIQNNTDLLIQLSQAVAGFGLKGPQLAQEIRALFTGQTQGALVAKSLGITEAIVQKEKEAGKLLEYLIERTSAWKEAGDRFTGTFTGALSNLGDIIDQKLGEATRGAFEDAKRGLLSLQQAAADPQVRADLTSLGEAVQVVVRGLLKLTEFAVRNSRMIALAFAGLAAASTGLAAAWATLSGVKLVGGLSAFLLGAEAAKGLVGNVAMIGKLTTATKAWVAAAVSIPAVSPFTAWTAGIGALTAAVLAGVKAWQWWKAKKEEALATDALMSQQVSLNKGLEDQIRAAEKAGNLTAEKAKELRQKLASAAQPITRETTYGAGFDGKKHTIIEEDRAAMAKQVYDAQKEVFQVLQQAQRASSQVQAESAAQQKFIEELAAARLEKFRAQQEVELARLRAAFQAPDSTVTIEEYAAKQQAIIGGIFEASKSFIEEKAQSEIDTIFQEAFRNPQIKSIKDEQGKRAKIEEQFAQELGKIRGKRDSDLSKLESDFTQRSIDISENRTAGELKAEKQAAENRLEIAKAYQNELLRSELELDQYLTELRAKQQNLPAGKRLTEEQIRQLGVLRQIRTELELSEASMRRGLNLEQAKLDAAMRLAQLNPSNDPVENQNRINDLLRLQNVMIRERISLNNEALQSEVLNADERNARLRENVELQAEEIRNRIEINRQTPTRLPGFQASLGFRNQLDPAGNITGRELIEPYAQLDTFLTGTLGTTFDGLSQGISGLITGTRTWAQVWLQAGNQIIEQIVQLILEYTLFNQIRMMLDRIFYGQQKAEILATSATAQSAQMAQAATATAAGAKTAAAYAPAAAATNTATWGASAAVGLGVTLAAIAAIIAAFSGAFAEGGVVRGPGGPKSDNIVKQVPTGTGVINAAAMSQYGGAGFLRALETRRLAASSVSRGLTTILVSNGEGILSPEATRALGSDTIAAINRRELSARALRGQLSGFAAGGVVGVPLSTTPINGEMDTVSHVTVNPAEVHVAIVKNERELRDFMQSRAGRRIIVDAVKGSKLELGIT